MHSPSKMVEMSPLDRLKSVKGEAHQGNYLINAKERHSEKKMPPQMKDTRKSTSSHGTRYTVTGGQRPTTKADSRGVLTQLNY